MTDMQGDGDGPVPTQLVVPVPAAALPLLQADGGALLRRLDPACLIAQAEDGRLDRGLAAAAHAAGIPVLLAIAEEAPHRTGADGVYLADAALGPDEIADWRNTLGPAAMIVALCGGSRHAAMEAAEAEADAIAFGGTPEELQELASWWAPLMEVPCIATGVTGAAQAAALAAAGVDFVMPDAGLWQDGGAAALAAIADALAAAAGPPVAEG